MYIKRITRMNKIILDEEQIRFVVLKKKLLRNWIPIFGKFYRAFC